ncbi:MarR family transcriptional regulator [Streptococcus ursoris]|uniref:MarR family transcriptional regulator n=2 Tax=Streptococcus ratti TaxID=1341 RepID=A0A7X9LC74_STRRT|nr:MarR family transcriptional regulator [Streptococcus ratti]NMD48508.1 MarR family transcriptional regulator [Streptococcus ratti]
MKLEQSWGYALSKVAQEMDRRFSTHLSSYDIDSRDYGILLTLTNHDSMTQIKISELMFIDRTTVGQLIDSLESKGFVKRQQNPKDRRQNLIAVTRKGQNLVLNSWEEMQQIEQDVIANLSDWQKDLLDSIANKIGGK